jgi:CDP-diacylglycerol---serine O-phosphatidyltransferase
MFSKRHIPNSITLLNLFLGCAAVVQALDGRTGEAALIIAVCAALDFLDGFAARLLRAGSLLGLQLDSLADLVSFGIAPAAIAFHYLQGAFVAAGIGGFPGTYLPYLAFSLAVFSGLRLGIFNLDSRQRHDFVGLPTPANALFFASFPVVLQFAPGSGIITAFVESLTGNPWSMLILTGLFSWLLVSPVRMFSMKFTSLKFRENLFRFLFLGTALLLAAIFWLQSPPLIMLFYLILSLIFHFNTLSSNHEVTRRN